MKVDLVVMGEDILDHSIVVGAMLHHITTTKDVFDCPMRFIPKTKFVRVDNPNYKVFRLVSLIRIVRVW